MKQFSILLLFAFCLFLFNSCQPNQEKIESQTDHNEKEELTENKEAKEEESERPLKFPFGEDISTYSLEKLEKLGEEGDCWGKQRHFAKGELHVFVDSIQCSEYYIQEAYYLSKGSELIAYHLKRTEINPEEKATTTYRMKEVVYNVKQKKQRMKVKNMEELKLEELQGEFENIEIEQAEIINDFKTLAKQFMK